MRNVVSALCRQLGSGRRVLLATLVRTDGSAPLPSGSMMLVGTDQSITGSVGGECVDAAVLALAQQEDGRSPRILMFPDDDSPWAPGPACGGRLHVLVEFLGPDRFGEWQLVEQELAKRRAVARVVPLEAMETSSTGTRPAGIVRALGGECPGWQPDGAVPGDPTDELGAAIATLQERAAATATTTAGLLRSADRWCAIQLWPRPRRLIIIGAELLATHLGRLADELGFAVTVCDPRPAFATADRIPSSAETVNDRPDRFLDAELAAGRLGPADAVCVLGHNRRTDLAALAVALTDGRLGYVGALGSRTTQQRRHQELVRAGVPPRSLTALRGPIGLDLGSAAASATALGILADIVAAHHGGSGGPLHEKTGPIHDRDAARVRPPR